MRSCTGNEIQPTKDTSYVHVTAIDGLTYQQVQQSESKSLELSASNPKKFTFDEIIPLKSDNVPETHEEVPKLTDDLSKSVKDNRSIWEHINCVKEFHYRNKIDILNSCTIPQMYQAYRSWRKKTNFFE